MLCTRTVQKRKDRENEILDITRELIIERGMENVSMLDIAKKAGLSKAALYLSFPSKEAILMDILTETSSKFVMYAREKLQARESGIEAIRTLWICYLDVFGLASDTMMMFGIKNIVAPGFPMVGDFTTRDGSHPVESLLDLIRDVLARGVADGTLEASIDPEKTARIVLMISGGIIDCASRLPVEKRDVGAMQADMKRTFEIVLRGLASERCDRSMLVLPDIASTGELL
jgi:AcrR family transcriptional regulator